MIGAVARKLFGSSNDRRVRKYQPRVDAINALEPELMQALRRRASRAHRGLQEGTRRGQDARRHPGAGVRDRARGGQARHRPAPFRRAADRRHDPARRPDRRDEDRRRQDAGRDARGLSQCARRHAASTSSPSTTTSPSATPSGWARSTASSGLTTGVIVHGLDDEQRKAAYDCDVTYGTNNELGFDYLRDNMKYRMEDMVQRGHVFAIVDEVDSILIDEARTPLIISGPLDDRSDFYNTIDAFIPKLDKADFDVDEKQRTVALTEVGMEKLEQLLPRPDLLKGESLYDVENVSTVHHVNQALRAHKLFQRDKDYIVRNGEVVIIDEFTGRMMPGRRYSEGLHQALEAKEHQPIQPENQTLASITFQNYFRLYEKLAGMTGTALTEADEFMDIYNLDVRRGADQPADDRATTRTTRSIAPTPRNTARSSRCSRTARSRGQPVLVGTTSIEKSEQLAEMLRQAGWEQHDFSDPNAFAALYSRRRGRQEDQGLRHPQRALPRAGSLHRLPGRRARRDHHRHQHGRPRHRHSARRQCRHAHPPGARRRRGPARARRDPRAARDPRAGRAAEGEGAGGRRPVRARHRAPREPPHRQPAARPFRPPGRSRPLEVLPVAGRRSDAHLRLRQARRHADQARPEGGRGDRPSLDQQGAGEGAAEGRGAQLRHPQEHPQVRQRDERPAQGHLRPAHRTDADDE